MRLQFFASARTSSRSAGGVPANLESFHLPQLPTSSFESVSSHDASEHLLVFAPPVVRVRFWSWKVNTRPSFERYRSHSKPKPRSTASLYAGRVFSGASFDSPRWAISVSYAGFFTVAQPARAAAAMAASAIDAIFICRSSCVFHGHRRMPTFYQNIMRRTRATIRQTRRPRAP